MSCGQLRFCGQFSILVENNSKLLHDDLVNNNIIELHRDSTINYQFIILNLMIISLKILSKIYSNRMKGISIDIFEIISYNYGKEYRSIYHLKLISYNCDNFQ